LFDPNETVVAGVRFALAEELLRAAGEMRFVARGGSMLPAILPGDELIVHRACLDDVGVGDVVLFAQNGRWYVHRVQEILADGRARSVLTRGDALRERDEPVFGEELLGRIAFLVRDGEQRVLSRSCSVGEFLVRIAVRSLPRFAGLFLRWHALRAWLVSRWHGTPGLVHSKFQDPV
jgi:signal peptidase I